MKKILLSAVIALAVMTTTNAQEKADLTGTWWGLGQIEYLDDEANDLTSFTVLPVIGTFVSPSVTVGMGVGYTSTTVGDADAVDAIILMPLARKYWGVSEKLFVFGQADAPITLYEDAKAYGFNIRPGIDYLIGGKFTIEASFGGLGYAISDPDVGDATGTLSFSLNSSINFGLKYLF